MKYYKFLDFILSLFGLNSHFTVIVKNKTNKEVKVTLFGVNEFMDKPRFGLPEQVSVQVQWWGYKRLMKRILHDPFCVSGFTIKSIGEEQINRNIEIESLDIATDYSKTSQLFPFIYVSAFQEYGNESTIHPFVLEFDEKLRMHLIILPNEKVKLIFTKGHIKTLDDLMESYKFTKQKQPIQPQISL